MLTLYFRAIWKLTRIYEVYYSWKTNIQERKRNKKENEDKIVSFYRRFQCFSVQNYLKVYKPVVDCFKLELIFKLIIFHPKIFEKYSLFFIGSGDKIKLQSTHIFSKSFKTNTFKILLSVLYFFKIVWN